MGLELRIVFLISFFYFEHSQSEVAGLLVSVAAAAARLVVAVVRQKRAAVSAEEGFAQVCSWQSQAETTLRKEKGKAGRSKGQVKFVRVREGRQVLSVTENEDQQN